jgi:hypothetical protein
MNKFEPDMGMPGLARVEYLDAEFHVLKAGAFVICAVTGQRINLDDLKYWNVDLQEAYISPEAATQRFLELRRRGTGE